jgi:pyruvate kinase
MKALNTKLIVTIGPATLDLSVFQELINIGIDYIRINSAYGNDQQYDLILNNLKIASPKSDVRVIWDIKTLKALDYAKKNSINTIALSFTEHSSQIENVRKIIPNAFVISKIESKKGVENFDAILDASDGIMIARGDLAKAVSFEKVPPLQKEFTIKTLKKGKFLITATEMLFLIVLLR